MWLDALMSPTGKCSGQSGNVDDERERSSKIFSIISDIVSDSRGPPRELM